MGVRGPVPLLVGAQSPAMPAPRAVFNPNASPVTTTCSLDLQVLSTQVRAPSTQCQCQLPTRSFSACSFSSCLVRMCFTTNLRATNSLLLSWLPHLRGQARHRRRGRSIASAGGCSRGD